MTKTETRLGLTNILKRLAYSYLTRGFGRHPIDHDIYDEVEVSSLYPWMPNPAGGGEYGAGVKVTFYRGGQRVRWVEFSIRDVGGGGDPTIFRVK
jgi:hypothetical protein